MSSGGTAEELRVFGWDEKFAREFAEFDARGFAPGRVTVGYGIWMRVATAEGEITAVRPGRMRLKARSPESQPVVGDWVALRMIRAGAAEEQEEIEELGASVEEMDMEAPAEEIGAKELTTLSPPTAVIEAVLPRRTRLARKAPGSATLQQVLAANVDYAWLVSALGPDFNPRRMERYLGLAREGGAQPVMVLNKADLMSPEELAAAIERTRAVAADVAVIAVSGKTKLGFAELGQFLREGMTVTLLGSSGVGKSTLINALAGEEWLETQEVRDDGRGRHTTTRRELRVLPGGRGLVIDTPGLREIQVWEGERSVEEAFPEIEELALQCRFSNCTHSGEPGCAVRAAVEREELSAERIDAWHKLQAEARALDAQRDVRAREDKKRRERIGSKAMKEYKKRH